MTLDFELPIKKSTHDSICENLVLWPLIALIIVACLFLIIVSAFLGQFIYLVVTVDPTLISESQLSLFPSNCGGMFGGGAMLICIVFMVIHGLGFIKFHYKKEGTLKK